MEKDLKILKSKTLANGSKYFGLFEKHIPELNSGSTVYLYAIGNLPCICEIIQKNPNVKYFICDTDEVFNAVQLVMDNVDISKIVDLYDIDMKFDCIVMNPPYQKNLHLKILAEAIKHLKDDNSKVVNLSPVRWLQDPTISFKKKSDFSRFNQSVAKHISDLNIILSKDAECLFGIGLPFNLGLYICQSATTKFELPKTDSQKLIEKLIVKYPDKISNHCTFSVPNNYAIVLSMMCGGSGNRTEDSDGSWFYFEKKTFEQYCYHNNRRLDNGLSYYDNRKLVCWGNVKPRAEQNNVQFETKDEALNFYKFCQTKFFRFAFKSIMVDVNVHPEFLPWLGDAINPRTGLKGYTGEWTDEDLYKYFNITPEEQKVIEDMMAKYV